MSRWICGAGAAIAILAVMGGTDKADAHVAAKEQEQIRAVQWDDLDQAGKGLTDFDGRKK